MTRHLFLDCHGDDVPLFACFSLQRHSRASVAVVFDSYLQPARGIPNSNAERRRNETLCAMWELDALSRVHFLGFRDDAYLGEQELAARLRSEFPDVESVYAPAVEVNGHEQHNLVGLAAHIAYPSKVRSYLTYRRGYGKSRTIDGYRKATEVLPFTSEHFSRKLRALSHYKSQMQPETGCQEWFLGDMREYLAE